MHKDNLDRVFQKFFKERTENLFDRFDGLYRAIVEETNDPLCIGRVRVRIPELHNKDVEVKNLPWAVPNFHVGGKGCGWWSNPIIGDVVWVQFEKNHPYSPIWVGSANPTRRKFYPLPSIHGKTPLSVNNEGKPADSPDDFLQEYLPQDSRPMSFGMKDRYGTFFELNSIGFFPSEHKPAPPPTGTDAVAKSDFKASSSTPSKNSPDLKYAVLNTKYGHTMMFNDVGYEWDKEFEGDFNKDQSFEIDRQKYLLRFFNEDAPSGRDQRRTEFRTRYGHKFEMRDVGWTKNRPGEYDKQVTLSNESKRDERWLKLRTKDGMLIQSMDHGSDPDKDTFIKRLLKTEKGAEIDGEDADEFKEDARQIRLVTRHGHKIAIDDRGSDKTDADTKEEPRGNGVLIKTRRGFGLDVNDKDPSNRMMLYTPNSKAIDLNDRFDYVMVTTDTQKKIPEKWKGTKGNEFAKSVTLTMDPETTAYHMKLDRKNKYVSMKTPEGQGIEMRDKDAPCASFTEITGPEDRGFWMSRDHDLAVWRSKDAQMYMALDDGQKLILIRNNNDKIQIISKGNIEVISQAKISMKAKDISLKADNEICMEAAGTHWVVRGGEVGTNAEIKGRRLNVVSMFGTHESIPIPCDPCGPAPAGSATSCSAENPTPKDVKQKKPKPRKVERNCAPNQKQASPVPGGAMSGGSGGFDINPDTGDVTVLPEQQPVDPLSQSGGVLWYGTVDKFRDEVDTIGLSLHSLVNNLNFPGSLDATHLILATTMEKALQYAQNAQTKYGGRTFIMRVPTVPNAALLTYHVELEIADYLGDIPSSSIEEYSIGSVPFAGTPKYSI